jgi:hypothetical protein
MKWFVLALAVIAAPMVRADTLAGGLLETLEPRPEDLKVFDPRLRMAARLVFQGTEELARDVPKAAHIDLQMGFMTSADVAADDVRLRCRVFFVNPKNHISRKARDQICFDGNLGAVAGQWVVMDISTTFRPVATDLNGTSGVRVEVTDEVSGTVQYFMPTYGWQGGQE